MIPEVSHSALANKFGNSLLDNKNLVFKLSRMDVMSRYKGSILGVGWSFFNPILMLTIYTFVFSFIFEARWGTQGSSSKSEFALVLFAGLLIHAFFSEVLMRAPNLILANTNYVKKVIFPLEILPVTVVVASFFHMLISLLILMIAFLLMHGYVHPSVIFMPLILLPLIPLTLGFSWFFSALGVYLRDVGQAIGVITTILLFMSPVFYPMSILPESLQWMMLVLNPLTVIIEQTRAVVIFGVYPNILHLLVYSFVSLLIMRFGFWFFQTTRSGFADVL